MKGHRRTRRKLLAFGLAAVLVFSCVRLNYIGPAHAEATDSALATSGDALEEAEVEVVTEAEVPIEAAEPTTAEETVEEDVREDASDVVPEAGEADAKSFTVDEPGTDYSITIDAPEGSLPYPKDELSVSVKEIEEGTEAYDFYLTQSADALAQESTESITFARFFDIEILHNGEKVEPVTPVEVKIAYEEAPEFTDDAEMSVVHFADSGTEVITDLDLNADATEITYEQESFSVTATVITAEPPERDGQQPADNPAGNSYWQQGKPYILLVKKGTQTYTVDADGFLKDVESFDGTNLTATDPFAWTFCKTNDGAGDTVLKFNSAGYDYGDNDQATLNGYTYIDPNSSNGLSEDEVVSQVKTKTPGGKDTTITTLDVKDTECTLAIDYANHTIKSLASGKCLSIDAAATRIIGGVDQADLNGVEFILTQPSGVPAYIHNIQWQNGDPYPDNMRRQHMVNHIDISIRDTVTARIDLAYGTYYNASGEPVVTISKNSPASDRTFNVTARYEVSQQHLRDAIIETFKRNADGTPGEKLENQYIITGYSSNNATKFSENQVRIEGFFRVSWNPVIASNDNNVNGDDVKQARLNHRILYKVTAVEPNVEFKYNHPIYGMLYDANGRLLTTKGDVKVESTFDYFDSRNECPPLQTLDAQNRKVCETGSLILTGTGGMDFVLSGSGTVHNLDSVAIEITNDLRDTKGNIIKPMKPVENIRFNIVQNTTNPDPDTVTGVNVGSYQGTDIDTSGYTDNVHHMDTTIDTSGSSLVYDYDVYPGMVTVEEDISTVPKFVEDEDGNIWVYRYSYIETDYVNRSDGNEKDLHVSDKSTNGMNTAIPEILGDYSNAGTPDRSDFVEFFSHNVYDQITPPAKKEVAPFKGNGKLGGVSVGDTITYEISYENYNTIASDVTIKDKLDKYVTFESASDGGVYDAASHTVTWTLKDVPAAKKGTVTLKVTVLEGALVSAGGPGSVVNGGDTATVQVANGPVFTLDVVENPVTMPAKQEIAPFKGNGTLGAVNVGDEITYQIDYKNYKDTSADIVITDMLDKNVAFVSASEGGVYDKKTHTVKWTFKDVPSGKIDKVTLKVTVLEGALKSKGGPGTVVNGGIGQPDHVTNINVATTTVKVGDDPEIGLDEVINPVAEPANVSVKTGDTAPILPVAALMILAACGILFGALKRRRRIG